LLTHSGTTRPRGGDPVSDRFLKLRQSERADFGSLKLEIRSLFHRRGASQPVGLKRSAILVREVEARPALHFACLADGPEGRYPQVVS
jgi:hypothetical protein